MGHTEHGRPAPVCRGEQRSHPARPTIILTCTSVTGSRVNWIDSRGASSWTGINAWRRLTLITEGKP